VGTGDVNTLASRFWNELQQVRTGMLGLSGAREAHSQPMTAHFEDTSGPLWFYTRSDSELLAATNEDQRGVFHYAGPDHQLYACVHGKLTSDRDQTVIDRFWNDEVARWFPSGPSDDSIALLKFEPEEAQIWLPAETADRSVVKFGTSDEPQDIREKATL
jgi:general stress protein 26